jgi:hypothetical protein
MAMNNVYDRFVHLDQGRCLDAGAAADGVRVAFRPGFVAKLSFGT